MEYYRLIKHTNLFTASDIFFSLGSYDLLLGVICITGKAYLLRADAAAV